MRLAGCPRCWVGALEGCGHGPPPSPEQLPRGGCRRDGDGRWPSLPARAWPWAFVLPASAACLGWTGKDDVSGWAGARGWLALWSFNLLESKSIVKVNRGAGEEERSEGLVRWEVLGWDGMGWDGMGWDGMGWDGMGWEPSPEDGVPRTAPGPSHPESRAASSGSGSALRWGSSNFFSQKSSKSTLCFWGAEVVLELSFKGEKQSKANDASDWNEFSGSFGWTWVVSYRLWANSLLVPERSAVVRQPGRDVTDLRRGGINNKSAMLWTAERYYGIAF